MTMRLDIAKEFSPVPIGRDRSDGKRSGEVFREDVLRPKINQALEKNEVLVIDFSGMRGLNTSFLEEAFGGLVRDRSLSPEQVLRVLRFHAEESYLARYFERIKDHIIDKGNMQEGQEKG